MTGLQQTRPPARRRVRFFFQLETKDLRAVFWAELDNHAGDFYWGPPTDGPAIEAQPFSGISATFTVPEDLDESGRTHWKASHQSTQASALERRLEGASRSAVRSGLKVTVAEHSVRAISAAST